MSNNSTPAALDKISAFSLASVTAFASNLFLDFSGSIRKKVNLNSGCYEEQSVNRLRISPSLFLSFGNSTFSVCRYL